MKMIKVYLNVGIDEEFLRLLKSLGVDEYIKIPKALGKLKGLEPMEDTHIWPGYFVIYEIPSEEKKVKKLVKSIREFADKYRDEGVCIIIQDIECVEERR